MILDAEQHARDEAVVSALAGHISGLLTSAVDRSEVHAWLRSVWPEGEPIPALAWPDAQNVLCCLQDVHRPEIVRAQDLRHYLRLLQHGELVHADDTPLVVLPGTLADLTVPRRGESERWLVDGLGWYESLRFVSGASGRPFVASVPLASGQAAYVSIRTRRADHPSAALWDLFELLGIDERDAAHVASSEALRALPAWRLCRLDDNGQEFQVESSRSREKLMRLQAAFSDRGHRQTYWVERFDQLL